MGPFGKNGEQESSLTQEEKIGLKSLQKRISSGEIIVIKTDKSSKLAVTTQEKYKEMGQEHVSKDKIIGRQEVIEMEEKLNGHSRAWANIFGTGKDHKHFERIIASKVTHSENIADLYLMYKDHKMGEKTRPTATGCTSNTLGLSNFVAEILESVSNSEKDRYNTISSEDMLARFHNTNENIQEINQSRNIRIIKKLQCTSCRIMETVDCEATEEHDWEIVLGTEEKLAHPKKSEPEKVGNTTCTGNDSSTSTNPKFETVPTIPTDLGNIESHRPASGSPSTGKTSETDKSTPTIPEQFGIDIPSNLEQKIIATRNLTNQKCCGPDIELLISRTCQECGPGTEQATEEYSLVGSDVKALFPSIKSEKTGEIIRTALENTELEIEGVNLEKALAYIMMNQDLTSNLEELSHLLPTRKSGRETSLKISAIKADWDPNEKFDFKNTPVSYSDKKKIIARVVEIGTRALFQNHAYRFGNEIYHQKEGGSIGDRWTGAAAEIVMQDWAKAYKNILENSKIRVMLLAGYVDDGRQLTSCLPLGYRFSEQDKIFQYQEQAEIEDKIKKQEGESTNQRMARICLPAMNSVNPNLEFTVEAPEDFEQERLPTLDFTLWQEKDGTINHSYFQKEVKTPYVIMARSGMAVQQKIQILSNELTRRIGNINILRNGTQEYVKVVEQFTRELKNSEFQYTTAREIVTSGIRGLRTRNMRREQKGQPIYRIAKSTARQRAHKKLVSKENWYRELDETQVPSEGNRCAKNLRIDGSRRPQKQERNSQTYENKKSKIKSVMFVPHTPGSELAKKLRLNEEHLAKLSENRVKIVERTGTKIVDLLTRSNPWKGADCERENCLVCFTKLRTEKKKTQDCHQRNIVYETRCLTCQETEQDKINNMDITEHEKRELNKKIKLFKYIGESSRSTFERGWEHLNDMAQLRTSSHMLKHALTEHREQDMGELKFGMHILRTCKSSFERQIHESVVIQQERKYHHILNSRSEYNRCSLPRLSTQVGENEYKEYNKELQEEKKQEENLERMIIQLRKQRNKARLMPIKGENLSTKRRKLNNTEYVRIQEIWGKPEISKPKKNQAEQDHCQNQPPNKKHRTESHRPASGSPSTGTPAPSIGENIEETQCQYKREISGQNEKIVEVTETNKDLEFGEKVDWEKVLREHKEHIEKEEKDRNNRLEQQSKKVDSWKLYNLCKDFLEENSTHWNKRREQQIEENKRLERLEIARSKSLKSKENERTKQWEKKFKEGLEKVPVNTREQQETEIRLQQKRELQMAKQNLWKLQNKEKKLVETEQVVEIRNMDKKAEQVFSLLEKEQNRLMLREKNVRTSIKNKKDPAKKQKLLAEIWTTYRWITEYLLETTTAWELEKNNRIEQHKKRLEDWNNRTRREKIEHIKELKNIDSVQNEKQHHEENPENPENPNNKVWKLRQETTDDFNKILVEVIINELIEQTINKTNNKQQIKPEVENNTEKITTTNMITNNSKSKKQQKINNYFCTNQQTTQQTQTSRNKELIRKPKLNVIEKTTTKVSPLPKTTNKTTKTNNNKPRVKKKNLIEEENKKLRGYWTTLAKKQKLALKSDKSETSSSNVHAPENQDLFFEGSPEATPNIMVSCNQPSLSLIPLIPTTKNCLPSNPSNMKEKLLEQPNLNIDVEEFAKLPD